MHDDCHEVLHELQIYLDGEASHDIEVVIANHLNDCPPCFDRADFERDLRAFVAARCREQAPAHLVEQVRVMLFRSGASGP